MRPIPREVVNPTLPLDEQIRLAIGGDAATLFDRDVAERCPVDETWASADTKLMLETEHAGRYYYGVYVAGLLVAIWQGYTEGWIVRGELQDLHLGSAPLAYVSGEELEPFRRRALGLDYDPVSEFVSESHRPRSTARGSNGEVAERCWSRHPSGYRCHAIAGHDDHHWADDVNARHEWT